MADWPLAPPEDAPEGTSRLAVSGPAPVGRERAAQVLGVERRSWLGEAQPDGRWLLDLELQVVESAPRMRFRKAAYLDVGPLTGITEEGPLTLDIAWKAAGMAPLFPVFAGQLGWQAGELSISGVYAPPGGSLGLAADRLLLHLAARGTGQWLLRRIASVMTGESG
ncbi:MAG TPA: hypothetical protein VJA85_07030 [Candidatus Limnocylindria bacterium]|nr:hypothetical protein [Candidatus Limnocylindria bacterium]